MTIKTEVGAGARSLAPHEAIAALATLYFQINRVQKGSVHERVAQRLFSDLEQWVRDGKAPNQQVSYRLEELITIADTKSEHGVMNNVSQTMRRFSAGVVQFGNRQRSNRRSTVRHEDECVLGGRAKRIEDEATPDHPARTAIATGINVERCTQPVNGEWKVVHIVGPTALLRDDDDPRYWLDVCFEPSSRTDPIAAASITPQLVVVEDESRREIPLVERDRYLRTLIEVLRPTTRYGELRDTFIERQVELGRPPGRTVEATGRSSWAAIRRDVGSAVITGNAGDGKTWLLRHEAIDCAEEALESATAPVPIHISLHDVVLEGANAPFVDRLISAARALTTRTASFVIWLKQIIAEGDAVVFLDDLDEIPSERRHLLELELRSCISELRSNIVIACRASAYEGTLPLPEVRLVGFGRVEIKRYINDRLREQPQARSQAMAALSSPPILEMCRSPLLLSLLCFVAEQRVKLPETRSSLYVEFLSLLLRAGWRETSRAIVLARAKVADAKEEVLQGVSEILARETSWPRLINGQKLEALLDAQPAAAFIRQYSAYKDDKAYSLLWELHEKDSVFLVDRISLERKENYRFLHPSFHPFLVARHLASVPLEEAIDRLRNHVAFDKEPFWTDTVILLAGYVSDKVAYLEWLLSLPNVLHRPLFLAARALVECPHDDRVAPIRRRIHARLWAIAQWNAHERWLCLRLLARTGGVTQESLELALSCDVDTVIEVTESVPGGPLFTEDSPISLSRMVAITSSGDAILLRRLMATFETRVGDELGDQAITNGEARNKMMELAYSLFFIRDGECVDELHATASDPARQWFLREAVVTALGDIKVAESEAILIALVRDAGISKYVRAAAAYALRSYSAPETIAVLVNACANSEDSIHLRIASMRALYGRSDATVREVLLAAVNDTEPLIAVAAAGALYPSHPLMALSVLQEMVEHEDSRVRRAAIHEIGRRGVAELASVVVAHFSDSDLGAQSAAFEAARLLPMKDAIPTLTSLLREGQKDVRHEALGALRRSADPAALDALVMMAKDDLDRIRVLATERPRQTGMLGVLASVEPEWTEVFLTCVVVPRGTLFASLFEFLQSTPPDYVPPDEIGSSLARQVTLEYLPEVVSRAVLATREDATRAAAIYFPVLEAAADLLQEENDPFRSDLFAEEIARLTDDWDASGESVY
jgi:HEAT repeat protein